MVLAGSMSITGYAARGLALVLPNERSDLEPRQVAFGVTLWALVAVLAGAFYSLSMLVMGEKRHVQRDSRG